MKTAFILWLAAGVALLVFYLWTNHNNKSGTEPAAPAADVDSNKASDTATEQSENASGSIEERLKMGRDFEEFVISLMPKSGKLVHRTADYSKGRVYAEENHDPDLSFAVFDRQGKRQEFAVECKWRSAWNNRQVNWCHEKQLARYRQYSQKRNMPVFIALGIGNSPSEPKEVYFVPLDALESTSIKKETATKYRHKDASRKFFYDAEKHLLI